MRHIACSCAIVLSLPACGGSSHDGGDSSHGRTITVGEQSNGTTVVMGVGEHLTVALMSAGDGGYSNWSIASAPDSKTLASTSSEHQPPPPGALPGNFGTDVFNFEAVAAGTTSVVATAVQPWAGGDTATFSVAVTVGQACSSANDCTGVLPTLCQVCDNGSTACAHFACVSGACVVKVCP
jgi:predicted secreted protein